MTTTTDIGPVDQVSAFLKDKEYYSHSSLDLFQACRRRWMYSKQWLLDPGRWSISADAGNVLHSGLATLHTSRGDVEAMFDSATARWHRAFDNRFQDVEKELEGAYQLGNLLDILLCYVKQWRHFPIQVDTNMVEVAAVCKIADFYYVCRMDSLASETQYCKDKYTVIDIKSMKADVGDVQRKFTPSRQFTGNVYVARQLLGERANLRPMIDALTVQTAKRAYVRADMPRVLADLEEWERETIEWVRQIRDAQERNMWPQSTKACNDYGRCPFDELCITRINPVMLRNYVKVSRTDPLHLGD